MTEETKKIINEAIKNELGISYDELILLDFDEQQEIIKQNRKKMNNNFQNSKVMIGSGENAIIINKKHGEKYMLEDGTIAKAGETLEESRMNLENRFDKALNSKSSSFIKRLTKKKNR